MSKKTVIQNELAKGMERELYSNAKKNTALQNLPNAVNYLHSAAEIFDAIGLDKQSNEIFNLLTKIANEDVLDAKEDNSTKGLTSEKMIKNLLEHGTQFNLADDGSLDDLLMADIEERDNIEQSEVLEDFEDEL